MIHCQRACSQHAVSCACCCKSAQHHGLSVGSRPAWACSVSNSTVQWSMNVSSKSTAAASCASCWSSGQPASQRAHGKQRASQHSPATWLQQRAPGAPAASWPWRQAERSPLPACAPGVWTAGSARPGVRGATGGRRLRPWASTLGRRLLHAADSAARSAARGSGCRECGSSPRGASSWPRRFQCPIARPYSALCCIAQQESQRRAAGTLFWLRLCTYLDEGQGWPVCNGIACQAPYAAVWAPQRMHCSSQAGSRQLAVPHGSAQQQPHLQTQSCYLAAAQSQHLRHHPRTWNAAWPNSSPATPR